MSIIDTRPIELKSQLIIAPNVRSFERTLQALLQNGFFHHIGTVLSILLIDRQAIEIGSVMNKLVRAKVLWFNQAVHLL